MGVHYKILFIMFYAVSTPWMCDLCSHIGRYAQKGPVLGLMLYCHSFEVLNNFIFELVFYK